MEFNLKVNQELLNAIVAGLDEIPTKVGMPAKLEITRQVEEYNKNLKDEETSQEQL